MFTNPFLREIEALYREADDPAHDVVFGDDTSEEWFERFHAVTALGLGLSDRKKRIEANRLLLFAMHFPAFPDGAIVAGENPDFVIELPNRRIGIELRDVYVDVPGRAPMLWQERVKDQIVEHARELYNRAGLPPVRVSFDFASNTAFREADIPRVAQELVKCVPLSMSASTKSTCIGRGEAGSAWIPELATIVGHAPHWWERDDPRWDACHGGNVYSSEEFLQSALDRKEARLQDYRAIGCDEHWLLLVIPGLAASSFMDVPDPSHVFASSFERVFYFQLHGTAIVELTCKKPDVVTASNG